MKGDTQTIYYHIWENGELSSSLKSFKFEVIPVVGDFVIIQRKKYYVCSRTLDISCDSVVLELKPDLKTK